MTALTLDRARAGGALATRERLGAALGWWRAEPLDQDEWLVLPRLSMAFAQGPGQAADAIAREFARVLARERDRARVDPPPGEPVRVAARFTSAASWYAWLAAAPYAGGAGRDNPDYHDPAPILRREVLGEPLLLIAVARKLAAAGCLLPWCAGLDTGDCQRVLASCERAVGTAAIARSRPGRPQPATGHAGQAQSGSASQQARAFVTAFAAQPAVPFPASAQADAGCALLAIATRPALAPYVMAAIGSLEVEPRQAALPELQAGPRPQPAPTVTRSAARGGARPALRPVLMADDALASSALEHPQTPPTSVRGPGEAPAIPKAAQSAPGAAPAPPQTVPEMAPDARFATDFAGLLFLLNSFLALGLYPDFTRPLGARLAPSPGWLLERIGMQLLGRRFAGDPMRRWLGSTGQAGPLPGEWRVREEWESRPAAIRRFRHHALAASWDRRGFFAALGPIGPRMRSLKPLPISLARLLQPHRDEGPWLAGLLQYLRRRLAQAGVGAADLALAGEIRIVGGDVAATIALADLPLALRVAGLDRDPGWIPAEGRSYRFEFA